jgi:hypothetical protein
MVKPNIGPKNRVARLIAAALLFAIAGLYYDLSNPWVWVAIALGLVMVFEGLFSYCIFHGLRGTKDMR